MFTSFVCSLFLGLTACKAPESPECYVDANTDLIVCLQPVEPRTPVVSE